MRATSVSRDEQNSQGKDLWPKRAIVAALCQSVPRLLQQLRSLPARLPIVEDTAAPPWTIPPAVRSTPIRSGPSEKMHPKTITHTARAAEVQIRCWQAD